MVIVSAVCQYKSTSGHGCLYVSYWCPVASVQRVGPAVERVLGRARAMTLTLLPGVSIYP